jgi:predicted nuclease with TOPRIM domain
MKMAKLYEITDRYQALAEHIADGTDEMTQEALWDTLEGIEGELADKAENIAKLRQNIEAEAEALKVEEQRLAKKRRALEAKADGLKDYLFLQLGKVGIKKLKAGIFNLTIRPCNPSVEIIDEAAVPDVYKTIPQPAVSKSAALEVLKAGVDIPGLKLVTDKETLVIR